MYTNFVVDLFLNWITGCLAQDAVVLAVTLTRIGDKDTRSKFLEYVPYSSTGRLEFVCVCVHKQVRAVLCTYTVDSLAKEGHYHRLSPPPSNFASISSISCGGLKPI